MNKEELIAWLKDNLSVTIDRNSSFCYETLEVTLMIEGDIITKSEVTIYDRVES